MAITVRFACGHTTPIARADSGAGPPRCPLCGELRIAHTTAPAPNFRGVCQGPSARTEALDAVPFSVASAGPLVLKES